MDNHEAQSNNNKHHHQNKRKKRLTQEQVTLLETSFSFKNKLDPELKSQLAMELGVPPRQVAIWYQNKRARERTQSLELDHSSLQHRLESVLAQNANLNQEIQRLKAELNQVQGALASGSMNSSGSWDEVANSNFAVEGSLDPKEFYGSLASDGYYLFG